MRKVWVWLILKNMFSCHRVTVLGSFCFPSTSSWFPVKPHLNLARKQFCLIQGICMQQCFTVVSFEQLGTSLYIYVLIVIIGDCLIGNDDMARRILCEYLSFLILCFCLSFQLSFNELKWSVRSFLCFNEHFSFLT